MAKKAAAKKTCPITRSEFIANGPKGSVVMGKVLDEVGLTMKESFSSGAFGYYGGGKITIRVGDEVVKCQVSMNVVVVDSKHAEEGVILENETIAQAS